MYLFNKNYKIPLISSNYYLYQITQKNLEIKYEIKNLDEDINLKLEAKIQFIIYKDSLNIVLNDGENEYNHIFEDTSSYIFELKKNKNYSLKLIPLLYSEFTTDTYFFISFGNEQDYPLLFYKNPI